MIKFGEISLSYSGKQQKSRIFKGITFNIFSITLAVWLILLKSIEQIFIYIYIFFFFGGGGGGLWVGPGHRKK